MLNRSYDINVFLWEFYRIPNSKIIEDFLASLLEFQNQQQQQLKQQKVQFLWIEKTREQQQQQQQLLLQQHMLQFMNSKSSDNAEKIFSPGCCKLDNEV